MKKLFTIILILASSSLFAQTEFAPLGAKWSYYSKTITQMNGGIEELAKYNVVNSYSNHGFQIKVVNSEITRQSFYYNSSASEFQFTNRTITNKVDSFYEQNDTVFVYNKFLEKFTQLYRFNVQEGEIITQAIFDTVFNSGYIGYNFSSLVTQNDDSFSYKIDSIRMLNYNGNTLETYFTSPVISIDWASAASPNGNFSDEYNTFRPIVNWTIDQRSKKMINPIAAPLPDSATVHYPLGGYLRQIGGLGSGLLPRTEIINNGRVADGFQYHLAKLTCYQDSALNYTFGGPCDSLTINSPLSLNSNLVLDYIKLYPNPVLENELFIESNSEFAKGTLVQVFNILGQQVIPTDKLDNKSRLRLDLKLLKSGIYLLIINQNGERFYQKFIKQ